jgi:hypothetical protein
MAEPKKEIVEISLSPGSEHPDSAPGVLKRESARITLLPRPAPEIAPAVYAIPRPLAWSLLGISAAIFLIQIWNYVVS